MHCISYRAHGGYCCERARSVFLCATKTTVRVTLMDRRLEAYLPHFLVLRLENIKNSKTKRIIRVTDRPMNDTRAGLFGMAVGSENFYFALSPLSSLLSILLLSLFFPYVGRWTITPGRLMAIEEPNGGHARLFFVLVGIFCYFLYSCCCHRVA